MKFKKLTPTIITVLLLVSFAALPVFSQEINSAAMNAPITNQKINSEITNPVVNKPISNKEIQAETTAIPYGGAVVTEYDVYIGKKAAPEVHSAITNLQIKPSEIFNTVFSEVENLTVNPAIEDGKVVHYVELKTETLEPRQQLTAQPLFDLKIDATVEFKPSDNKIIINEEQVIDYTGLTQNESEDGMMIGNISIQSAIQDGKVYNLSLGINNEQHKEREHISFFWTPDAAGADNENLRDWSLREGRSMPIYSDFKVENKKLYLLHNEEAHDLKILPPEIYSAVHDLKVKEPKIVVKELSLKIENEKPIYDLKVKQPAKILWIIPWKVESKYVIDPADGSMKLVDSPWYITSEKLGWIDNLINVPIK